MAVFVLTVWLAVPARSGSPAVGRFVLGTPGIQNTVRHAWIPAFDIYYFLGVDGISLPLVLLTSFLSMLAMWASWPIVKNVRAYCILFLLLETGMLGVFLALDFFLFYVFWEVMLLPMYFLIGIWGGPRREYAAIKFFLFTLVGSVLMLVAMLLLYFAARRTPSTSSGLAELGQLPNSPFHKHDAVGQIAVLVGVRAALHRLRDQAARRPGPHLAPGRPRGSPHADFDDSGRRAVEDGRLRRHSLLLPHLS